MGQRNPAPLENGGNHPSILLGFQPSEVQEFATIHSMVIQTFSNDFMVGFDYLMCFEW